MPENIDWDFISSLEGTRILEGYVPDPDGSKSGVSIATGFDIGQNSVSDLNNLALSAALVTKLTPYVELKGQAAVTKLKETPLTITEDEAKEIDKKVKAKSVDTLRGRYDSAPDNTNHIKFDDLASQAQTVIASVHFQYGNLGTKTPKFWKAVATQDWTEAVKLLRNFGDRYPTRRGKEADLLEQIVTNDETKASLFGIMQIWKYFAVLTIFFLGCDVGLTQTGSVVYNPQLAQAVKNYDQSIKEKRADLMFESGKKANNCVEYWENNSSPLKEDVSNMLHQSEYLVCDALQAIKKNKNEKIEFSESDSADKYATEIFKRLDLSTFPSSFAQSLSENEKTFEQLKDKLNSKVEGNAVVSQTEDWNFAAQVVAETDFNNDGKKDLIIWIIDESKTGNYRSYSTILVSDIDKDRLLKAEKTTF